MRPNGAAEILTASEAIEEGQLIKTALSMVLGSYAELVIVVDSKGLFTSLSTQRNSIDLSIRADVNVVCIAKSYMETNCTVDNILLLCYSSTYLWAENA